MSQIEEHVNDLIRTTVDIELNAKRFYEHAALVTHNELGKKMFARLAKEEVGHIKDVGEIFSQILGNDSWKAIIKEETEKHTPSKLVDDFEKSVHEWGSENKANDTEALRMAMELERRAITFFEDFAKKHASEQKVHDLAESLAEEERFHYDMLQAQYDSLQNLGIWLDHAEFKMDGTF